jgi:hypothetical protein
MKKRICFAHPLSTFTPIADVSVTWISKFLGTQQAKIALSLLKFTACER